MFVLFFYSRKLLQILKTKAEWGLGWRAALSYTHESLSRTVSFWISRLCFIDIFWLGKVGIWYQTKDVLLFPQKFAKISPITVPPPHKCHHKFSGFRWEKHKHLSQLSFFLSFTERIFFQTRRLRRVCNEPIKEFVFLCRALRGFCS